MSRMITIQLYYSMVTFIFEINTKLTFKVFHSVQLNIPHTFRIHLLQTIEIVEICINKLNVCSHESLFSHLIYH